MSQAKALGALILIIIVASVGWFIKSQADEIGNLKITVGSQQQTIDKFKKEAKLDKESGAVTDKVVAQAAQDHQVIYNGSAVIGDKTKAKEKEIRHKYEAPLAEAKARATATATGPDEIEQLVHQQEQEISANRIDGVWEEYCQDADAVGCPIPTAT